MCKVVATNWKKLLDKLEQKETREAVAIERSNQVNSSKNAKIKVPHEKIHAKSSVSHGTSIWKPGGGNMTRKSYRRHCKWPMQKDRSLHCIILVSAYSII